MIVCCGYDKLILEVGPNCIFKSLMLATPAQNHSSVVIYVQVFHVIITQTLTYCEMIDFIDIILCYPITLHGY